MQDKVTIGYSSVLYDRTYMMGNTSSSFCHSRGTSSDFTSDSGHDALKVLALHIHMYLSLRYGTTVKICTTPHQVLHTCVTPHSIVLLVWYTDTQDVLHTYK